MDDKEINNYKLTFLEQAVKTHNDVENMVKEHEKKLLKTVGKVVYATVLTLASAKLFLGCSVPPPSSDDIRYLGTDNKGNSKVHVVNNFLGSTLTFDGFGNYLNSTKPMVESTDFREYIRRMSRPISELEQKVDFPVGGYFQRMYDASRVFQLDSLSRK